MSPWLAIPLMVACNVGSAVAFGPGHARRATSYTLAALTAVPPFFVQTAPLLLAILALGALLPALRILDLRSDRRAHAAAVRIWFFLSPFDVRRATRAPPGFAAGQLLAALGFSVLFAGCITLLVRHPVAEGDAPAWVARWLLGAVAMYSMADAAARWVDLGYAAIGVRIPPIHDNPILSRSLAEFWGARWNRSVHGVLEQHCFRPFARRRHAVAGIFAAFVGSAVLTPGSSTSRSGTSG